MALDLEAIKNEFDAAADINNEDMREDRSVCARHIPALIARVAELEAARSFDRLTIASGRMDREALEAERYALKAENERLRGALSLVDSDLYEWHQRYRLVGLEPMFELIARCRQHIDAAWEVGRPPMPRPEVGPWTPGTLYTPSNGSEGDVFMARWCERCAKDGYTEEHPENGCTIIVESMCGMEPPQWVIDSQGWPTCTAFEEAIRALQGEE